MVDALARTETPVGPSLRDAQAHCLRLARDHYENFTVLSWLTPRSLRVHRAAIYAYCRTVDDLGDEGIGDRLHLLDRFEEGLDAAFDGNGRGPIFGALGETIGLFDLPREPFAWLIEANRIDQRQTRYETFGDLLGYCAHSANPVGRLVLMLHGHRDESLFDLSDATCTALQLANFWQDVARDHSIGRIYLPQDEMAAHGVRSEDLHGAPASEGFRSLMRFQVNRTRDLFARGLPLLDHVGGRLKAELALFSRGGLAVLEAIEAGDFDTLRKRPAISNAAKRRLIASTLLGLLSGSRRWT